MPKRIQRKRIKGWRMPGNAMSVTRPGKYGNPFKVGLYFKKLSSDWFIWMCGDSPHFGDQIVRDAAHAIALFEEYAQATLMRDPQWLELLCGKDLACFCKEGEPCHADVLLRLANQ